jgi:hypothetical protein
VKAKVLTISFDANKDSAVRRWTPQAFFQQCADRDAKGEVRDVCQEKLRQLRDLFRVTTSDNIAEVLGVLSELDSIMSRLPPALSALCFLRISEEAVGAEVGTALMLTAQAAVEGTKRVLDIWGKI